MNVKHVVIVLLAFFLVSGSLCCSGDRDSRARYPLRVGWFLWSGWYPMAIAQEKGFFKKHNAAVEPVLYQSYEQIIPDFAAGKINGAFAGLYEILKANIDNVRVIMQTDYSNGAEGLVVASSIRAPADMINKRIGVQGALTGSEFVVTSFLRKYGISRSSVIMVDVSPENVIEKMPAVIDGGYTWDPYLSRSVEKGFRIMFTTADTPGMVPDVVAFHGIYAEKRAEDLQGFVEAWFEAVAFWKAHPDDAVKIISRVTGLKPDEISLKGCRLLSLRENVAAFSDRKTPESLFYVGNRQIEFFIGLGDASKKPDLKKILDAAFVKRAAAR